MALSSFNISIYENPHLPRVVPRFKLKDGDFCSESFRCEFNTWAIRWFGVEPYVVGGQTDGRPWVMAHPSTVEMLRARIEGI